MIDVKDIEMKQNDLNENTPETFLAYNETISTLQAINMQYEEVTKNMCLVGVYATLAKVYPIKEVYIRVLEFMRENEIYERYLSAILELQFNPPKVEKAENGEKPSKSSDNKTEKQDGKGGIGTKVDDNKRISDRFINDLFKDEDNE